MEWFDSNFEINLGTPFSALLELSGGMKDGIPLKAVIPGGSSVPVVPGELMMATNMDYDSIGQVGSMLGSGAVIVMNDTTDMVKALQRISRFTFQNHAANAHHVAKAQVGCTACSLASLKVKAYLKTSQNLKTALSG